MLLKKSFCTRDQNFFWLYTRLSCNDVGDQLPGDLGNVIEAIGLHRAIFYNRKIGAGQFGTFQQHRPSVVIRRSKIAQCSALPLRSCGSWISAAMARVDNVPFHKAADVEEAIQAVGASLRYLPPYSPDLNPIELLFHPLKTWLRKAAERTMEGLHRCVGSYIRGLDPAECIAYFRHSGYEPI
jgi:hypothetical protein